MDQEKVVLELLYDMVELKLTPREHEIITMYQASMKPRHIAEKLGVKPATISRRIIKINDKIDKHISWIEEKKELRGLV